jgi:DNA-binding MarR family transcriptional regulator
MSDREAAAAALNVAVRGYQREIDALDQALAERLGLNRTDLRCLDLLLGPPMSARELADAAGLSQSAVTTVLDRLERVGYAQRIRDDVDRRRLMVQLTPAVLAVIADVLGPFAREAAASADRYTVDELTLLTEFFVQGSERRARHALRIRKAAGDAVPEQPAQSAEGVQP